MARIVMRLEFKADKKEPLGAMTRRVADAFAAAGLEPAVRASFCDGPIADGVSAVARALKKHPELAGFAREAPVAGAAATRCLTNDGDGEALPWESLLALADGVPRSLPFHVVAINFNHASFGEIELPIPNAVARPGGVLVADSWWVNGRNRRLAATYVIEADDGAKRLPSPPPEVAAVLASLGKPKTTTQAMLPPRPPAPNEPSAPTAASVVGGIAARFRAEFPAFIAGLDLPHELPPPSAEIRLAEGRGPLKPALVAAFGPRGYDCRGDHGTFTLRRRTPKHHVVDLTVDVGTWSHSVSVIYVAQGPGYRSSLRLPVTKGAHGFGQYPIGNVANWERIVANLAAIVDAVDGSLAAEIEASVEPAPAWFEPGR